MATGEFDLIARHLTTLGARRSDVVLGVGDDAAILEHPAASELRSAATCIALTELTSERLARSIQDSVQQLVEQLTDKGCAPAWVTLALTLSQVDDGLVQSIADAIHRASLEHNLAVVGGDTTSGKPSLTIFVLGVHE